MTKTSVKKVLQTLTKERLVNLVLKLYDGSKEAKDWLEFRIERSSAAPLEKYRKEISAQFFKRNGGFIYPSFRTCNSLISAFKKFVPDPMAVADLMLYYVEQGCLHTNYFGDAGFPFYNSVSNNFSKAAKYISDNDIWHGFDKRIVKMIRSLDWCGWRFPDVL